MTATLATTPAKYTKVAITLHWVLAVLVLYLLFPGHELIEVRRGESLTGWGPTAHASLGILVLLLTVFRIAWRVANPPPPLPATMPAWQVTASHALHAGFYVLMLAIPLFGWLALAPFGAERLDPQAITFFNMVALNFMPNFGHWTEEAHEISGTLAKALIALHVLAALKHQFIDKDGLMRRMMFR